METILYCAENFYAEMRMRQEFNDKWAPQLKALVDQHGDSDDAKKLIAQELKLLGYFTDAAVLTNYEVGWRFCEAFIIGHWEKQHEREFQPSKS